MVEGADVRFVKGDVRPVYAEMCAAANPKNVRIVGGGDLAGQFYDAGLLNDIIVQVGSVTLGKGKQLFPRRVTNPSLRLVSAQQIGSGFAELHYEVPHSNGFNADPEVSGVVSVPFRRFLIRCLFARPLSNSVEPDPAHFRPDSAQSYRKIDKGCISQRIFVRGVIPGFNLRAVEKIDI